tara:strand:+ start:11876 stop:12052 length:177 start_codon:yes stop_codon:yes gene_type:complete
MARTNRRREPEDITNPNKGTKKIQRRSNRKNLKNNLKKMDYSAIDVDEEEVSFTRGYN